MNPGRRFTLVDMIVCFPLALVMFSVLYVMLGCGGNGQDTPKGRVGARHMGGSHVRGIISGCILYAQGNKEQFPGMRDGGRDTTPIPNRNQIGFATADGAYPGYRYAVLLNGNFFTPEYAISPAESGKTPVQVGQNINENNFSYAMLRLDPFTKAVQGRLDEWRASNNSQAVVISDRNIGGAATAAGAQSIRSKVGDWRGTVVFNDNHVNFETTLVIEETRYAGNPMVTQARTGALPGDNLFQDDLTDPTPTAVSGADAAMVYHDTTSYVNQK